MMILYKKLRFLLSNFRSKYRVNIENPHNEEAVWHIYLSPLNIFTGALALLVVMFVIITTIIAFTTITDYIPGHPGNKSRNLLVASNMKLDSLERELNLWSNYYDNMVRVMDGEAPMAVESSATDSTHSALSSASRIEEDSILRRQMEEGTYKLQSSSSGKGTKNYIEMFAPIKGVVAKKFNPKDGMFGVNIVSQENQPIVAIMDGTVMQSFWTPAQGSVMYILHPNNTVSGYLHNSRLMKNIGDRVSSGEVIAFTGSSTSDNKDKGFVEFQLWYNGSPVDPENYIIF